MSDKAPKSKPKTAKQQLAEISSLLEVIARKLGILFVNG
jgi:hypothetical protein